MFVEFFKAYLTDISDEPIKSVGREDILINKMIYSYFGFEFVLDFFVKVIFYQIE